MNFLQKRNYTKIFTTGLLFFSALYFCFICTYTVDQWDLGFILSMIGRLQQGQIIYKDFDYVRPFFGLAFWDYLLKFIPVTSEYFILISRFFVVIQTLIISTVIQKLMLEKVRFDVTVLFSILFLNTFPILPWHTIDGIFFGVLSLYFYKRKWLWSTLIFLVFTGLVKQSFFIFSAGVFLVILKDFYKNFKVEKKDLLLFILSLSFLLLIIYQYHIIEDIQIFWKQVFNLSVAGGFYENALAPYLYESNLTLLLVVCFLIFLYFLKIDKKYLDAALLVVFSLSVIYPFFNNGQYMGIRSLFLILFVLFLKYDAQNRLVFFLLLLGWSAAISWAGNNPIFLVFILLFIFINRTNLVLYFMVVSLVSFSLCRLKYTYQSDSILYSPFIFTKHTPSVSGLLISENDYEYISEANSILSEYKNVVFLPGSPILDVIHGRFINRASWELDVEYPSWKSDFSKLEKNIFAVDNKQIKIFNEGFYKSSFAVEIVRTRKVIKKTKYFTIYGPLDQKYEPSMPYVDKTSGAQ
ncbi:hypothetical protein [Chryseobacterium vrystaatense]|uniref:Glycosyltransferase RgtA/B/C/D-like domain-containing protein n=1 Tax=Chryseobacterium vrystaatense TaxID=307480 RepID=A0ABR4UII3_9FLAO|nr:hypothetical protein [Chryseobacterium vrystaatense]KFF24507.1 hypothetical protein IW16_19510 [Chryseobacterium vrystaatense]